MNWKKKFASIVLAITSITLLMHFINRIIHYFATCKSLLTDKKGKYYEWRFGDVYYEKHGSGKPVLLIHNTQIYSSSVEWDSIIESLSKTNTVYAIDLPGCGRSEKPIMTYTNFLYVQLISDFVKYIIGEKTDIVTSGSSISIATMTALYNNEVVDKIIVSNPTSLSKLALTPNKRSKLLKKILILPVLGTFLYNLINNKHKLAEDINSDLYKNTEKANDKIIQLYYETLHKNHTKSKYLYANIIGRYTNANILNSLRSINNSIYIISSSDDNERNIINEQYKEVMPSIEILKIDTAKNYPHMETPTEFIEQITILLEPTE